MRLEQLALACRQGKFRLADNFARAFAGAKIVQGKLARIAPISVIRRIGVMRRDLRQIIEHHLDTLLAEPIDEVLKRLALFSLAHISFSDAVNGFRNPLRRNSANSEAVLACVVPEFTAQHDLKMRHLIAIDVTVDAVKTDVSDVMLAAGVEAAAHLNTEIFYRFVQRQTFFTELLVQLARKASRRSDAQFACVGSGASRDIDDGRRVRRAESDALNRSIKFRQVRLADPTEENILLDGRAKRVFDKAPRDVSEGSQLIGAGISQRKRNGRGHVARLSLLVDVCSIPGIETLRALAAIQAYTGFERLFRLLIYGGEVGRPARIRRKLLSFFTNELAKLVYPQVRDQEFDPRAGAIAFFAEASEDSGNRLRHWQQLFFRQEFFEQ